MFSFIVGGSLLAVMDFYCIIHYSECDVVVPGAICQLGITYHP